MIRRRADLEETVREVLSPNQLLPSPNCDAFGPEVLHAVELVAN
jgi:hypothetical protein